MIGQTSAPDKDQIIAKAKTKYKRRTYNYVT